MISCQVFCVCVPLFVWCRSVFLQHTKHQNQMEKQQPKKKKRDGIEEEKRQKAIRRKHSCTEKRQLYNWLSIGSRRCSPLNRWYSVFKSCRYRESWGWGWFSKSTYFPMGPFEHSLLFCTVRYYAQRNPSISGRTQQFVEAILIFGRHGRRAFIPQTTRNVRSRGAVSVRWSRSKIQTMFTPRETSLVW